MKNHLHCFRSDTTPLCSERFCPLHHGFFLSYLNGVHCLLVLNMFALLDHRCLLHSIHLDFTGLVFAVCIFWNSLFICPLQLGHPCVKQPSLLHRSCIGVCWHHPPQLGQHATTSLTAWLSSALRSPSISSDRHRCLMYVLLVSTNC